MIYTYRLLWLLFYILLFIVMFIIFAIGILISPIIAAVYYIKYGNQGIENMSDSFFPIYWVSKVDNWYKDLQK